VTFSCSFINFRVKKIASRSAPVIERASPTNKRLFSSETRSLKIRPATPIGITATANLRT